MKAWLQLLRLSNMPTVWTNVGAGMGVATFFSQQRAFPQEAWLSILFVLLAASCLYAGGMVQNDVFDVEVDRVERRDRPIPSGRVSLGHASAVGWILLVVGVVFAALGSSNLLLPMVAAAIAVLSVIYNREHRVTAWSVVPLGFCRALLYPLGVAAVAPSIDTSGTLILVLLSAATFVHTVAFSIVARDEVWPPKPHCPDCGYALLAETAICPECGALTTEEALAARTTWDHQTRNILVALGTFALAVPAGLVTIVLLLTLGTDVNGGAWPLPGVAAMFVVLGCWLFADYRRLFTAPPDVRGFVLGSIAAFCLYDASILILVRGDGWLLGLIALALFFVVRFAHRSIPGT